MPFGALVPQGVENLLVAGRCASATPEGQSSIRVSGACFVMGEAAGTAAVMRLAAYGPEIAFAELQQRLLRHGVFLG